jgi:putative oxidoreductase
MKINYALVTRSLIALLFVIAGVGKIFVFSNMVGYVGMLGIPFPTLTTLIAIVVEVPIALMFAWGYETRKNGYILIAFTALATLFAHHNLGDQMQMMMALKNIAIIGGIMAAIGCACGDCEVHSKKSHDHNHHH